ncbi:hypothetical protein P0Y35_07600 [Kiritimatiellaeota bacterium B1221]|nr:hypothetical protein [Kiritimatiellaeota bacterium B1221]
MFFVYLLLLVVTTGLFIAGKQNPVLKKWALIPAVIAIIASLSSFRTEKAPAVEEMVVMDQVLGNLFGERILQDVPGGGVVAVIQLRPGDPDPIIQAIPEVQLKGLQETLGDAYSLVPIDATRVGTIESSQLPGGLVRRTRDFQEMLEPHDGVVAVVSFAGLPVDPYVLGRIEFPPLYGLMDDVLPENWETKLPPGIAGVVSIQPRTQVPPVPTSREAAMEIFEKNYIFTPELPVQ